MKRSVIGSAGVTEMARQKRLFQTPQYNAPHFGLSDPTGLWNEAGADTRTERSGFGSLGVSWTPSNNTPWPPQHKSAGSTEHWRIGCSQIGFLNLGQTYGSDGGHRGDGDRGQLVAGLLIVRSTATISPSNRWSIDGTNALGPASNGGMWKM